MRTILRVISLAAVMAGLLLVGGPAYAQVTSTRVTSYDWRCVDPAGVTVSEHQRLDSAFTACLNLTLKDGKARTIEGGRYRITATAPAPALAQLSWTAPTLNTDGSPITGPIAYRVEVQAGTAWSSLATVTATSYTAPTPTGCWRVIAIAGGMASDPTGAACKS